MEDGLFTPMGMHVALVHFPIALLITGTAFELAGRTVKKETLSNVGYYMLVAGIMAALPALATGLLSKNELAENAALWPVVLRHQAFALASVGVFAVAIVLSRFMRPKSRDHVLAYVFLLVVGSAVLSVTGYLGGQIGHSSAHVQEHESDHGGHVEVVD